jgi:hypothetical protein
MTPTFFGRIQTRIFVLLTIGVLATLVITPFLPLDLQPGTSRLDALPSAYAVTFSALAIVLVLGVVIWEPIYHLLQQFRWEKDWPTMFGFLNGINEGILTWFVLQWIGPKPTDVHLHLPAFIIDFAFVWIATFLFVNGPMRILSIRWRFNGGRLL